MAFLPLRDEGPAGAAAPDAPNVRPYEAYFASGHYDRRYPVANPTVLRLIRQRLPRGGHVLDFGCGSGRYLLALRDHAGIAAGYDVCQAALERLQGNIARGGGAGRICLLGPDPWDIDRHLARHGTADVVLCLFGVLSHIEGRALRRRTLRRLAGCLKPGSGRLILSVPNRARRFRSEQRGHPDGEIRYVRSLGDLSLELSYKLFDLDSFREELEGAGFALEQVGAESLVPEALVANSPVARASDRMATPFVPAGLGYGLLGVARPIEG
jgi:tRNA (uracil-5-)-methyltransferase TRM9